MRRVFLGFALVSVSFGSQAIDLSTAGYVTYGDGNSYSLPLNGLEVKSGSGQIALFTKLGLQSGGILNNNNDGIMDNAYDTPSANTVEGFRTGTYTDPGANHLVPDDTPEGEWDQANTWDATLKALDNDLDLTNNTMVFFFANNETGAPITDNLAAWARLTLEYLDDNSIVGTFDLTNDGGSYGDIHEEPFPTMIGGGVFGGNVADYTADPLYSPTITVTDGTVESDFLRSGGNICVNALGFVTDCDTPYDYEALGFPAGSNDIVIDEEHNLGANNAAYAVVFPELDALIAGLIAGGADLTRYALHVDYRLGCGDEGDFPMLEKNNGDPYCDPDYSLNGGAEKVFLGTQESIIERVPAPATLALFGLGLLGLAGVRSRRAKI